MKFYIASRLENADTVRRVSAALKTAGHVHTYDWTEHGSVKSEGGARIIEVAENEKRGVMDADIVIVILPGGRGTHAELGIALGTGKDIVICAEDDSMFLQDDRTCAFYWNIGIIRVVGSMDKWLAVINEHVKCGEIAKIREIKATARLTTTQKSIAGYTQNPELQKALEAYLEMRAKNKCKLTDRAIKLLFTALDKAAADDNGKITAVERATVAGWKSFYPIAQGSQQNNKSRDASYDLAELEKLIDRGVY